MHNAKCKVQNYGVGFADDFNWSRSDTFILHSAFCILHSKQTAGRGSDATAACHSEQQSLPVIPSNNLFLSFRAHARNPSPHVSF